MTVSCSDLEARLGRVQQYIIGPKYRQYRLKLSKNTVYILEKGLLCVCA